MITMRIANTSFSKFMLAPALALAATLPLASIAHAGDTAGNRADDIVVTSPEKMQAWQDKATRKLNRGLERGPRLRDWNPSSGIVQLSFDLNEKGRPDNIEVRSNSANWTAARVAHYAVRQMGDISDVPVTNAQNARFLANVIFAQNYDEYEELAQDLERTERARLASGQAEAQTIVLGG
jgi:hypothetical protein